MAFPKAMLFLVFIIIGCYITELASPQFVLENFSLSSSEILHKPWTIFTHIFLHDPFGFQHIFYNLFALIIFGSILENIIGFRRFVMLFFASGLASALAGIIFYPSVIGASGAIFGILGTLGIIRPRMVVWVLGIPVPMLVALVIWAFLDLVGFFLPGNVANASHIFGMATGIIYGFIVRQIYAEKSYRHKRIVSDDSIKEWEEKWMKF